MNKTQAYLLGVGTGLVITLIMMMNMMNSVEQQEQKLNELQAAFQHHESENLSTEIYTYERIDGIQTELTDVYEIENKMDILEDVNKTLDRAIREGILLN